MKRIKIKDELKDYIHVENVKELFTVNKFYYVGADAEGYRGIITYNSEKDIVYFTCPPETDEYIYMGEKIFVFDDVQELYQWMKFEEDLNQ